MKRFLAALALLTACATSGPHYVLPYEPTIGALLPIAEAPSAGFVVAGAAQTWPAYRVTFHDVEYLVGIDPQQRIRYIETTDSRFVTREGLRVGSTLGDVLAAGGRDPLYEAGWGRYSTLQSGWNAFFAAPQATESSSGTPQVLSYFRRDGLGVDQRRVQ